MNISFRDVLQNSSHVTARSAWLAEADRSSHDNTSSLLCRKPYSKALSSHEAPFENSSPECITQEACHARRTRFESLELMPRQNICEFGITKGLYYNTWDKVISVEATHIFYREGCRWNVDEVWLYTYVTSYICIDLYKSSFFFVLHLISIARTSSWHSRPLPHVVW